jgi:hypothetical protein
MDFEIDDSGCIYLAENISYETDKIEKYVYNGKTYTNDGAVKCKINALDDLKSHLLLKDFFEKNSQ